MAFAIADPLQGFLKSEVGGLALMRLVRERSYHKNQLVGATVAEGVSA
jgi:hypothetical protein